MAVFVTGATGFIGAKLCHELAQREESVVAFCRKHPQEKSTVEALTHPAIRIVRGDVKNLGSVIEAIRGCKSCIHLAGLARQWSRRSRDFYDVNVGGTRNVLEAAISSRVERFVFVSTAGVYGPSRNKDPIVESSPQHSERTTSGPSEWLNCWCWKRWSGTD